MIFHKAELQAGYIEKTQLDILEQAHTFTLSRNKTQISDYKLTTKYSHL